MYRPSLAGGGGAIVDGSGFYPGAGGGVLEIVAGQLVLDGELLARGGLGDGGGAGAGGTVHVQAQSLRGAGSIDASGGATDFNFGSGKAGNGGGGRVSLWIDDSSLFDVDSQVLARQGIDLAGGLQNEAAPYAAPGTIFVRDAAATYGRLIVDPGTGESGADLGSEPTRLPLLGSGAVASTEVAGADLWVAGAAPFRARWHGAWMVLEDASSVELGVYRVEEIDPTGRVRLAGASAVAASAEAYSGEYRFDSIDLRHSARLESPDPLVRESIVLSGVHELDGPLEALDIRIVSGAVVRPKHAGQTLRLVASGNLVIEAGALLDVTGYGLPGGAPGEPGTAPPGVDPAGAARVGGAHGGLGSLGYQAQAGDQSEVYDSVYRPFLPGSGAGSQGSQGTAGGGVLELEATSVVLDGELRARGLAVTGSGSGGSGGTVVIDTSSLGGSGTIDVSGADQYHYWAAHGGGGRVALFAADVSGFDLANVVLRGGGQQESGVVATPEAAPGTLYVRHAGSTYGDLIVDGGFGASPTTHLPVIGHGIVGVATTEGADLWIEPQDPAARFSVGVAGMWVRIAGVEYAVLAERADRRGLLLEGAAGVVTVGLRYVGIYRFDSVTVRNNAHLRFSDGDAVGTWNVEAGSSVSTIDLQPPVLTIDAPAEGALYAAGDPITVTATATDPSGVTSATLHFDGQSLVDATAPFEWTVTAPPVVQDTQLSFQVEAIDAWWNVASAERTLQVQPVPSGQPPTVAILCPGPGALLAPSTGLAVAVDAQDDHAVDRVELYLGGVLQTTLTAAPYEAVVSAPGTALDGQVLTLEARAFDAAGQTASASVDLAIVEGTVITADTTALAGDPALAGTSVVVASGTLTLHGQHDLRDLVVLDGARITHLPAISAEGLVGHWTFDHAGDPGKAEVGPALRMGSAPGADANDPDVICSADIAPIWGNGCGLDLDLPANWSQGDYAYAAPDPSLSMTEAYTLSAWVRVASGGPTVFMPFFVRGHDDSVTNGDEIEVYMAWNTRQLAVSHNRMPDFTDIVLFPIPPQDVFFHLAITFDGVRV
ncbi:MAG: Ig-like domain-containing protein, partial [Holophagales bacterium]|nr:Ig-like domain-containing protein [Holophagales bacterium]